MMVACLSSLRSKDPSTKHGACIVNQKNIIIGTGYNGFPRGCEDDVYPWGREGDINNTKMPYVVHSELNAILNASSNLDDCRMYLYSPKGYYPCQECAKAIIQSGIVEVVVAFVMKSDTDVYSWEPTKRMFDSSGVNIRIMDSEQLKYGINILNDSMSSIVQKIV